jgi:hypothetical protein
LTIEAYPDQDQLEPEDQNAPIWRFMTLEKFRDLVTTSELYFCRADRFCDESEGLPPEEYLPILRLNPLDLLDRQIIDDFIGCMAQFRESYYISCWHLFREETLAMWRDYGKDGVAICSQYSLLKSALDAMTDRASLGLVRYAFRHLTGWNTLRFITTKRMKYASEQEVRALLWITDEYAGMNRHFDIDNRAQPRPLTPPPDRVPNGQRRTVDLKALVTEIIVAPQASSETFSEIEQLVRETGYEIRVQPSGLARFRELLPG